MATLSHVTIEPVSRARPCLLCGKGDWCYRKPARGVSVCHRVTEPPAGWRRLGVDPSGGLACRMIDGPESHPPIPTPAPRRQPPPPTIDWTDCQERLVRGLTRVRREAIEQATRLCVQFLAAIGLGYSEALGCYTFPMFDCDMRICGMSTRRIDGRKAAIKGSRQGVYAVCRPRTGTVLLCEGATDTAAMLSLGYWAVGRPSCRGGEDILAEWCQGLDAVIVSDSDSAGRSGAEILGQRLRRDARSVRIIEPVACKDAREWVNTTATRTLVDDVIRQARPM